jgi:hypothetical protein
VYFSFFLIAAAILLSAMFFRLGAEQRVREIGTLTAAGFSIRVIRSLFLREAALLSILGSALGVAGAIGYAWIMVLGLRTWWSGAVGTDRIQLHVSWSILATGAVAGVIACLAVVAWTLRSLGGNTPRSLLAGTLETRELHESRSRRVAIAAVVCFAAAALLLAGAAGGRISQAAAYFGAGFLLLVSMLALLSAYLRRHSRKPLSGHGVYALLRFGVRNARHRPGRSLICAALIASAVFVIVSVEAFRRDPQETSLERDSGTGGYSLIAQSALPVIHDPDSEEGRDVLGLADPGAPQLAAIRFQPFRERPGDDASCLNLYAPLQPRILGVPRSFVREDRFSFQQAEPAPAEHGRNPWLLLERATSDGSVPAIADANTIQYVLHKKVGDILIVRDGGGKPLRLRLTAALRDSIFQGELLISEANFLKAFPEREGYRFFLLEVSSETAASLVAPLEEKLSDWGVQVESTRERLAAYHRVENTYISTFQSLGALGLLLGTAGLAAVLLRNVLERRRELAVLRAVGYRRQTLSGIVVAENLFLLLSGLAAGTLCALIAIAPAVYLRGPSFPVGKVSLILAAVLVAGLSASILAVRAALRSPLLQSLKSD